jgi:hypothetical protein
MKKTTIKQAKAKLSAYGISLVKRDGELRVRIIGSPLDHGYFTDDVEDAVSTGIAMSDQWFKRVRFVRAILEGN